MRKGEQEGHVSYTCSEAFGQAWALFSAVCSLGVGDDSGQVVACKSASTQVVRKANRRSSEGQYAARVV